MTDPHRSNSKRRWLVRALILGGIALNVYFLIIVPTRVAVGSIQPKGWEWAVALWMCFLFWVSTITYAIAAARALYGCPPIHLEEDTWENLLGPKSLLGTFATITQMVAGRLALPVAIGSYFFAVYGFALLYAFISHRYPAAFNCKLSLGDSIYFSIVSAATVGYGDIVPKSDLARFTVSVEIVFTLLYGVFIFSIINAALQRRVANANAIVPP